MMDDECAKEETCDIQDVFAEPIFYLADCVKEIRRRYKIPNEYVAHYSTHYGFEQRLKILKPYIVNLKHIDIESATASIVIHKIEGLYKFKGNYIATVMMDRTFFIVFTKNLKKFETDFLEKKPIIMKNGLYKIEHSIFGSTLVRVSIKNVTKPILNKKLFEKLDREIIQFRKNEKIYREQDMDYKRGILLYGLPGNGKTCFIKHLLNKEDSVNIIVDSKKEADISFIYDILNDPLMYDRYKVIILEDIDGIESYIRSKILNMIDGLLTTNKTVFLATTNFPDKLDEGITNRPSRFDSFYKIDNPNDKSREKLLSGFFPNIEKEILDKAVKETKDFRGSYFKEIYLLTKLNDIDIMLAIKELKEKFKAFKEFINEKNYLG